MNKDTINRIIDYALCHLNSNWDDWIEEDLGISNQTFTKLIKRFQEENISIDKITTNI
jgi:hypothetical protein